MIKSGKFAEKSWKIGQRPEKSWKNEHKVCSFRSFCIVFIILDLTEIPDDDFLDNIDPATVAALEQDQVCDISWYI
mgnify:CR=1 FL=1